MIDEAIDTRMEARSPRASAGYLDDQLRRIRLLLRRRMLWLREHWQHDPLQGQQGLVVSDAEADWLLEDESRESEQRFYREDSDAEQISRAIADLECELAATKQSMLDAGAAPPIEALDDLFGLSSFERDVVLLCLAPLADPGIAQLYAYVQDGASHTSATRHLAMTLFATTDQTALAARYSFSPDAALRRYKLIVADDDERRTLRIDERMADYVCDIHHVDERLTELLRPLPAALSAPLHHELADRLGEWARLKEPHQPWSVVNLIGRQDAGKEAIARGLAERLGLSIANLDVGHLSRLDAQQALRLVERECILSQMMLYIDASAIDRADTALTWLLNRTLDELSVLTIVASREPWETTRDSLVMRVEKPDAQMQVGLWRQALSGHAHSLNGEIGELTQHFDLGPLAIEKAVTAAQARADMLGDRSINASDLWQTCRESAAWHLDNLAQRLTSKYVWDDIVLPEDLLCQLREIALQVAHRHHVYEAWGFGQKLSRGRGLSVLFAGPSGTGKTMAAEILASHLQLDLYRVDLAGVISKYIGETEKNLQRVFDAAERTGAMLLFDEADALFSKRTDVKDSHDRYANIEVNYLLQRMEDYRGLAILATNRKTDLDRAFVRRLRFIVDFPFPDNDVRRRIWHKVFPAPAELDELDYDTLARLDIAGGSIRNIALNAAFLAAGDGVAIGMKHVLHAARREYSKLDKMLTEIDLRELRPA